MIRLFAPEQTPPKDESPTRELGALRKSQVWLTLATGAIGGAGMFSVYSYLQSTLTHVTLMRQTTTPWIFALFGIGMTLGNLLVPPIAERFPKWTAAAMLALSAAALAFFPIASRSVIGVSIDVVAIGVGFSLSTILQTRLMDVAGKAQALAAALNQSAFNIANAIGPVIGGLAISAGWGYAATGYIGCVPALIGLMVWGVAALEDRRSGRN